MREGAQLLDSGACARARGALQSICDPSAVFQCDMASSMRQVLGWAGLGDDVVAGCIVSLLSVEGA